MYHSFGYLSRIIHVICVNNFMKDKKDIEKKYINI